MAGKLYQTEDERKGRKEAVLGVVLGMTGG